MIGLIGTLKRVPFDIPNAKSEIGEGPLTEYSGRKLALWKLSSSLQTWVGLRLLEAVYLGGADRMWANWGLLVFAVKMLALVAVQSLIQVLYARLRIDQLASLGWRILVPLGILQILVAIWTGGN
jgi:NADH-quinone oxidoreductase subunit H